MAQKFALNLQQQAPLISTGFLYRLTVIVAVLAVMTVGISIAGRWFGQRISLAGHTNSTEIVAVTVGQDLLHLPANTIRFARQRVSGPAERIDLYLTWPDLQGYSDENRRRFNDISSSTSLMFLQVSQSTMSRDMSGRLEPIYAHLFQGKPQPGPHGLTIHRFKPETGYGSEVVLTAPRPGQSDYVVRCLMPATGDAATSGDCQRDIHIGRDLTVLYRFSSALLGDWSHIDAEIGRFVERSLSGSN